MKRILSADDIESTGRQLVGGKGHVLAQLSQNDFTIPKKEDFSELFVVRHIEGFQVG